MKQQKTTSRAQSILENFDDVITNLMTQMDDYARQSGGYINRMHPDQFDQQGNKKELLTEQKRTRVPKRK